MCIACPYACAKAIECIVGYGYGFAGGFNLAANLWAEPMEAEFANKAKVTGYGLNIQPGLALMNSKLLAFLKVGYVDSKFKYSASTPLPGNMSTVTLGFGAKYAISDNIYVGLEYENAKYGDKSGSATETGGSSYTWKLNSVSQDRYLVNVGYRF